MLYNLYLQIYAQGSYIIVDEMFDQYPTLLPDSYFGISGSAMNVPYTHSTNKQSAVRNEFMGSVAFGLGYVNRSRKTLEFVSIFIY
jgi:hypothetical protein